MQQINHWPDMAELSLPETVSQDLHKQLLEPFDSEKSAKKFWEETRTTIIILEPFHSDTTSREFWQEASSSIIILDSIDSIEGKDQLLTWNQIGFTLTYPEYTVPLSNGYQLLVSYEELFHGTIDGATVHVREIVKLGLSLNAAAIICAHNHPSGVCEPSHADESITKRIKDACALMEIRLLDHLIVSGKDAVSFAERGLI